MPVRFACFRDRSFVASAVLCCVFVSCRDQPTRVAEAAADGPPVSSGTPVGHDGPSDTAIATLRKIRTWREQGLLSKVERYLLADQRAAIIDQIRAIDRLTVVVRSLQSRVRDQFGLAAAQSFNHLSEVANIAGVLSRDVKIIDESATDPTDADDSARATIVFQIKDRLPLNTVEMVNRDGRWMLVEEPIAGVAREILNIALLLERVTKRVDEQGMTIDLLRREIALRQTPILRRLQKLVTAASISDPGSTP
jgi:hypothetical protein